MLSATNRYSQFHSIGLGLNSFDAVATPSTDLASELDFTLQRSQK